MASMQRPPFIRSRPYPGWDWPGADPAGVLSGPAPRLPQGAVFVHFGWPQTRIRLRTILANPGVLDLTGHYDR